MFPASYTTFSYRPHLPRKGVMSQPASGYKQCCEAVAASKTNEELHIAAKAARNARKEYLSTFDPAFLTDRRDRKVAARSRWVFALGALSGRLLRRLTRLIHI